MELLERIRSRLDLRRSENREKPSLQHDRDWRTHLHDQLDAPGCTCPEYGEIWSRVDSLLRQTEHEPGKGYDAGVTLAEAAFIVTRHLRPSVVVETGVARGVTSRLILEALELNSSGRLYSIDLPPRNREWRGEAGMAVTESLKSRWTFVRGSSRQKLDPVIAEADGMMLFVHDSLHSYRNMTWEYGRVWPKLPIGGWLISDDVEDNRAFADFLERERITDAIVVKEEYRSGYIGLVRKTGEPTT